ncbi:hypothetical protein P280DRAFT_517956 [Massarina eburnea CBS 473.64]|uniref:Uncharacterized protein n=1 Tax=Massarina eburnea CBS 473.64 TaxID=1395130 RepID=A0A6A6RYG4_9PLEO|nr:hypothetical protein P280DRAFT_517956 [Massarina eburnea CBS 473.64]
MTPVHKPCGCGPDSCVHPPRTVSGTATRSVSSPSPYTPPRTTDNTSPRTADDTSPRTVDDKDMPDTGFNFTDTAATATYASFNSTGTAAHYHVIEPSSSSIATVADHHDQQDLGSSTERLLQEAGSANDSSEIVGISEILRSTPPGQTKKGGTTSPLSPATIAFLKKNNARLDKITSKFHSRKAGKNTTVHRVKQWFSRFGKGKGGAK